LDGVKFHVGSITDCRDYSEFDVITLIECFYYLDTDDQSKVLAAIRNSGHGILMISAPIIGENQYQKYYTESELRSLVHGHGFEVEMSHVIGLNYPPTKVERVVTLVFKAIYLSPIGGMLESLWDKLPDRWVYQKLFVCRY
jgi:hypothetical protein